MIPFVVKTLDVEGHPAQGIEGSTNPLDAVMPSPLPSILRLPESV